MAEENFEKLNDYTLMQTTTFDYYGHEKIRRIFNFEARQISEISSHDTNHGLSTHMAVTKFSALDSTLEVQRMHKRLIAEGGTPPAIDDLLNEPAKPALKSATLRP